LFVYHDGVESIGIIVEIRKSPLEPKLSSAQEDFFNFLVIFCKNGTLSARDIMISFVFVVNKYRRLQIKVWLFMID
jgi:hypothetical protein